MKRVKNYLVILAGLPRGGEGSWKTLYEQVVKNLDADLAICTEDVIDKKLSLYSMADYLWLFKERENWENYYINNYSENSLNVFKKGKGAGLWESGMIHMALKDMIHKNYLNVIKEYKYFIYARFDQFYTDYHPVLSGENIWIPEGENYYGINDRHAIVNSKFSNEFFNICSFIESLNPEELDDIYLNCETIFKMHLENSNLIKNVKRIKRFQFTSAALNDFTRWRVPKYNLLIDKKIKIKYPDEFIEAVKNIKFLNLKLSNFSIKKFDMFLTYFYFQIMRTFGKLKRIF